jgi:hypothetical protein
MASPGGLVVVVELRKRAVAVGIVAGGEDGARDTVEQLGGGLVILV